MNSLELDLSPTQENSQHKWQGKHSGLCQIKPHSPKMTQNPRNSSRPGLKGADSQHWRENPSSAFTLPCPGLDLGCVGDLLLLPDILLLLVVVELLDALVAAGLEQGGVGLQDQREITFQSFPGDTALSQSLRADPIQLCSGAGITWDHLGSPQPSCCSALGQ